jgi:hypothetical protein
MKKFLAKLSDLPNAYRVLEIMDNVGCDIEKIETNEHNWYRIKPKWYATKQEALDLRTIVLHKQHYKKRSSLWRKIFHNTREGYRYLYFYK